MNVYVIPIEPIDTRYTRQWYDTFPALLKEHAPEGTEVIQIDGEAVPPVATKGMFLDFTATNIYKSSQLITIAKMFRDNKISAGDKIVFTDFWNPCVIQLKYMIDLLGIPVELHGLAHAGHYDKADALGQLIPDGRWANRFERALFHAFDKVYFATEFHIDMFKQNVFGEADLIWELTDDEIDTKFCRTGWPMQYMPELLTETEKEDIILFPHRVAPEKQPDIFYDLKKSLPEYEFVVCQEKSLTKDEYHALLGKAKLVFSANLQETLGISAYEGALAGAIPLVPDRLSYTEMYEPEFKYPSAWTLDYNSYIEHKDLIIDTIKKFMTKHSEYKPLLKKQAQSLSVNYFTATSLLNQLFGK